MRAAEEALAAPGILPSARVLEAMARAHDNSFISFVRAQSERTRTELLALPFSAEERANFERMTQSSIDAQKEIEANDSMPFEIYREQYVSPLRLGFKNHWAEMPSPAMTQPAAW